jgi:hypothetical protein
VVRIPRVAEADISQNPDPWYRIEHAVWGYVELVRSREQDKRFDLTSGVWRELRDGPRDRKHREEAMQHLADIYHRSNVPPPAHVQETPRKGGRPSR